MALKFCKTCKVLCFDNTLPANGCKHKIAEITEINEPVRLCIVGGTERAMLTGMLKDEGIPYMEENVQPQGVANEIVTGYDVKLSNISLVVPFQALPKASELLSSLETVPNEIEPHIDEIKAQIEYMKGSNKEDKPMSAAKRTTVKVLSVIALLIVIALVVFGTDAITSWIKSLF